MSIISLRGIKKEFAQLTVLKDVSFDINPGDRIGLVGSNGAGKTTLAAIIHGSMVPDGGSITKYDKSIRIGYLRQSTAYTEQSFSAMLAEEDSGDLQATAGHLGLSRVRAWDDEQLRHLSGGERTKLALAGIWAENPGLLILDEPTNHMDFQGVSWLVDQLAAWAGTVLVISHDRWFLDQAVSSIVELDAGTATCYPGNYSCYRDEKKRRYDSQLHQYVVQKKQEQRLEADITQLEQWSAKAHRDAGKTSEMRMGTKEHDRVKAKKKDQQVKSRLKMLQKMRREGVERPRDEARVNFEFDGREKRGRRLIEAILLSKAYGDKLLFEKASFFVQRGDRVGLLGPNGCGKSTLLRMIMGLESPDQGELWLSPSVRNGYLSQDVSDLDTRINTLELLDARGRSGGSIRTLLANMGFSAEMLVKPIGCLSLGERTRIKLARLILQDVGLLVLDEPTNHLDLPSREQLEQTLIDYDGTIILVSHDRYMLERVCNKLLIFERGKIRQIEGGWATYQRPSMGREDRLVIETRLARVLGELTALKPGDARYAQLDMEFRELSEKRKLFTKKGT